MKKVLKLLEKKENSMCDGEFLYIKVYSDGSGGIYCTNDDLAPLIDFENKEELMAWLKKK